ncbi:MAG: helix-turn-helix domain-containing protein [Bacteroidales bacterium]|nr:helix-turn-helix domain-containing protein [Bacteroidales bacterium]
MKDFLHQLTELVEANLTNDQFNVTDLAHQMGMSRSNLHRKVKQACNMSVSKFICRVRIEKAKELLLNQDLNVSEAAFESGFHSVSYFTKCFRDHLGISPGEFKRTSLFKKHNKGKVLSRTAKLHKKYSVILLSILLILAVGFIGVVIFRSTEHITVPKSVAIYPFTYISSDSANKHMALGMKEAIHHHLSKFDDLRVLSKNTPEEYAGKEIDFTRAGRRFNVSYILLGSFQKDSKEINLNVRLINASDGQIIWSNEYFREWTNVFELQREVARQVAEEIGAVINPEEERLISETPTFSLTAYDFYQRGREEFRKHQLSNTNRAALDNSEKYYREALNYDPEYAQAYAGLAEVYKNKKRGHEYFSSTFLDSMLTLANKALELNKDEEQAHVVKGLYYWYKGQRDRALKEYDYALSINPNLWEAYRAKATLYIDNDLAKSIDNYQKALSLVSGQDMKMVLKELMNSYLWAGFIEEAERYNEETLSLFGDSLLYLTVKGAVEEQRGDIEASLYSYMEAYRIDSGYFSTIWFTYDVTRQIAFEYMLLGDNKKSLEYYEKWTEMLKEYEEMTYNAMHRIGYAFWQNGYFNKANEYFDLQIDYCNQLIELNRVWAQDYFAYYDRAGVYAFRGDRACAYRDLEVFSKLETPPLWMVNLIKTDPLFEKIRDEARFCKIMNETEKKYVAYHKRIEKQLKEMGYI